jgi:hypothetical protein
MKSMSFRVSEVTLLLALGCQSLAPADKAPQKKASEPAANAPAAQASTAETAQASEAAASAEAPLAATAPAESERAAIVAFVERWVKAQNAGNFADYSALYAPEFAGTKRVGDKPTLMKLDEWLRDRKKMFERDARVVVSGLQIMRDKGELNALFEQRWSTSTFADQGAKVLTLQKTGDDLRIVREEMLSSKVGSSKERGGACGAALKALAAAGPAVRFYAYVATTANEPADWVEFGTQEEAYGNPGGEVWELWAFARSEGWSVTEAYSTSPSGDWSRVSQSCFRPDGTLATLSDSHRTFYSEHGLVDDVVFNTYSSDGKQQTSKTVAYYVASGKPATPNTYVRPPPNVIGKASELPFYKLTQQK